MEKQVVGTAQGLNGTDDHHRSWAKEPSFSAGDGERRELPPQVTHLELVRMIERMHRRYLDRLRLDLNRLGANDISPSQVMLLFTIGDNELSVRDLVDRGHYLGSNASYSLKQLVQAGYVERSPSQRDRRSARISLTEKGRRLCRAVQISDEANQRHIVKSEQDMQALQETVKTLRRLEIAWATSLQGVEAGDIGLR